MWKSSSAVCFWASSCISGRRVCSWYLHYLGIFKSNYLVGQDCNAATPVLSNNTVSAQQHFSFSLETRSVGSGRAVHAAAPPAPPPPPPKPRHEQTPLSYQQQLLHARAPLPESKHFFWSLTSQNENSKNCTALSWRPLPALISLTVQTCKRRDKQNINSLIRFIYYISFVGIRGVHSLKTQTI